MATATAVTTGTAMVARDVVPSGQVAPVRPLDRTADRHPRTGASVIDEVPELPEAPAAGHPSAPAPSSPRAATDPAPALEPPPERRAALASKALVTAAVERQPALPVVAMPRFVPPARLTPPAEPMAERVRVRVEESRPVIRVTIGRIEVRAVAAPAPPPRSQASVRTPAIRDQTPTLEEYLRARNGRSR